MAETLSPRGLPVRAPSASASTPTTTTTFNRDNVTLVDSGARRSRRSRRSGLRTPDAEYELDSIVFATGFDAMTGALLEHRHPRARRPDAARTSGPQGPRTYLGLAVAGFPNLFTITGPGSPSVLSNMIVSIEQHVDWIADCLAHLREHGRRRRSRRPPRRRTRGSRTSTRWAHATLYPLANSWYMGANIPGKPRVFMPYVGGVGAYRQSCDEVAAEGYAGFTLI